MNFTTIAFFLLTYLISWGIWLPLIWSGQSTQWLFWLAGFGPTLTAIILTGVMKGEKKKFHKLWGLRWKVKPVWYFISILGTPLIMMIALAINIVIGGAWPQYIDPNHMVSSLADWPVIMIVFLYILIFTALGEEFGWRGFVLPRLQAQFTPFFASLILGVVWAGWHLPLFWIEGDLHQQLPVVWFLLQIIGSTFLYTWMFNRTKGSLVIALLFHTTSNAAVGLLPILPLDNGSSLRPLWLVIALLWIFVGLVLWFDRHTFFKKISSHEIKEI